MDLPVGIQLYNAPINGLARVRFRRKPVPISALTALAENRDFARFAQNNAARVSDFVRKCFGPVADWLRKPFLTRVSVVAHQKARRASPACPLEQAVFKIT